MNGRAGTTARSAPTTDSAQKRVRSTDDREVTADRYSKRIKITNIPRDLNARDIRDAFESEAGRIEQCQLDRGIAHITFSSSKAARKAVETFDRGELNGKTIEVTLTS